MMNCNIDDEMYRFIYEARVSIVEKQDEIICQAISHIGGKEFRHITIDRNKVIEALTDYMKKQKNKADFVEVVRCKDCNHWIYWADEKRCSCDLHHTNTSRDDFCSYGERKL